MPEQPNTKQALEFVDPGFPTIYTNNAYVGSSGLDFSMLLGEHIDDENLVIRARVVMVPATAKMLLQALAAQIAKYEDAWGTIQMPTRRSASTEPEQQP